MMPGRAGQGRLGVSGGTTHAVMPSKARQRVSMALRLLLARRPKWRIRTRPLGRTWIRKRRRNSSLETVMTFFLPPWGIILPEEGDAIVLEGHETMIGNGDAVGVARQVVENLFRTAEGWLGVDDPVLSAKLPKEVAETAGRGEILDGVVKLQPVLLEEFTESSSELAAEDFTECFDGQEVQAVKRRWCGRA